MAQFWVGHKPGRLVRLDDPAPALIGLALDPLPPDAPAVVVCHPLPERSPARVVTALLDELETAAVLLCPAWLPGAEVLAGPGGAGLAAARALAIRKGATTPHFGPFLAELAEHALTRSAAGGQPPRRRPAGGFAAEVRAAGLARVIADSYQRPYAALLVHPSEGATGLSARALLAGCEWLASHGGFAVWLAGAGRADGLADGTGRADGLTGGAGSGGEVPTRRPGRVTIRFPALAGRPHPASRAEQALEAALVEQPWAAGRSWNQTYQPDPLTGQIRVDLMWQDERCAVEIDGPEHHAAWHYEADRRRDVLLQLAGFAVLRFTNAQIDHDLRLVLSHIEALLTIRRSGKD